MSTPNQDALLRACRASGQISDAQWVQHCAERPDLLDASPVPQGKGVSKQHPLAQPAFDAFAAKCMPWLLEPSLDDVDRLNRATALIAFQAGRDSVVAERSEQHVRALRASLEPHLVKLIAGLRRHQVEEAVELLLDYIDVRAPGAQGGV